MVPNFTRNNNHHQSAEATQYTDDNTLTSPLYNQSQYTYTHSQELSTPGPSEQQQQQQQISMVSSPHLLMLQQSLCHSNQSTTKDNFINTSTGELNLFEDITSIYSINNNNNTFPQHPALPTPGYPTTLDNSVTNANQIRPSERGTAGFVSKLYQSLQGSENGCKYAGWCHHNDKDMFVIVCIPKFTDYVLPRLFKHRKFASFVRQLNIYGFQRDTDARKSKDVKDKETCRWYHPFFRPGRPDLLHLIRRKATQHTRKKQIHSINEDPETILILGSGNDFHGSINDLSNGNDGGSDNLQRRQSSVSSASNLAPSQQGSSLQSISPSPSPSLSSSCLKRDQLVELGHQDASSRDIQPNDLSLMHLPSTVYDQPTMQQQQYTKGVITTSIDSNVFINIFNRNSTMDTNNCMASSHSLTEKEHQLQLQLRQLQTNYINEQRFYTQQIQIAYSRMEQQKIHIKRLETILAQQFQYHPITTTTNLAIHAITDTPDSSDKMKTELTEDYGRLHDVKDRDGPTGFLVESPASLPAALYRLCDNTNAKRQQSLC